MLPVQPCPYKTLGLATGAPLTSKARAEALRKARADMGGDTDAFEVVQRAIRVLKDERARNLYAEYGWAGVLAAWQEASAVQEGGEETDVCEASGWLLALRDGSVIATREMTAEPDLLGVTSNVAAAARAPPACWPKEVRTSGFADCGGGASAFAADPSLLKNSGALASAHAPIVPVDVLVTPAMIADAVDALTQTGVADYDVLCDESIKTRLNNCQNQAEHSWRARLAAVAWTRTQKVALVLRNDEL